MSIDAEEIRSLILNSIPDAALVSVEDVRGDGIYYTVTVVSSRFAGMTKLEQHRLVYGAIGNSVNDIEALQLVTRPEGALE